MRPARASGTSWRTSTSSRPTVCSASGLARAAQFGPVRFGSAQRRQVCSIQLTAPCIPRRSPMSPKATTRSGATRMGAKAPRDRGAGLHQLRVLSGSGSALTTSRWRGVNGPGIGNSSSTTRAYSSRPKPESTTMSSFDGARARSPSDMKVGRAPRTAHVSRDRSRASPRLTRNVGRDRSRVRVWRSGPGGPENGGRPTLQREDRGGPARLVTPSSPLPGGDGSGRTSSAQRPRAP